MQVKAIRYLHRLRQLICYRFCVCSGTIPRNLLNLFIPFQPFTQSLEALTAARLHGVPAKLLVFENEAHQVFQPQNNIVWNREFFGWLDTYLKN